jgi:regulatory protein
MSQITSILPQVKDKTRFNIFVDGKFAVAADAEIVLKKNLKVGKEITPEDVEQLENQNKIGLLMNQVLGIISRRPRSKREIEQYLHKKHATDKQKEIIIMKLGNLGYVNDKEFIDWWLDQRQTFRPRGKIALFQELRQKGIDENLINEQLEKNEEEGKSEFILARKLAEKRLSRYKNLPPLELRQKMTRYLIQRGFTWDTAGEVIDSLVKKD